MADAMIKRLDEMESFYDGMVVRARALPGVQRGRRGADRIRTGVRGFAGLCLTSRPRRRAPRIVAF